MIPVLLPAASANSWVSKRKWFSQSWAEEKGFLSIWALKKKRVPPSGCRRKKRVFSIYGPRRNLLFSFYDLGMEIS